MPPYRGFRVPGCCGGDVGCEEILLLEKRKKKEKALPEERRLKRSIQARKESPGRAWGFQEMTEAKGPRTSNKRQGR